MRHGVNQLNSCQLLHNRTKNTYLKRLAPLVTCGNSVCVSSYNYYLYSVHLSLAMQQLRLDATYTFGF